MVRTLYIFLRLAGNSDARLNMTLTSTTRALGWFSTGAITFAVAGSIFTIFVLHWYDPKFQDALVAALQLQLMGLAVLVAAGIVVLSAVMMLKARARPGVHASGRIAWVAGIVFPIGILMLGPLLQNVDPESLLNPLVGWGYTIVYPLVAGLLISRDPARLNTPG